MKLLHNALATLRDTPPAFVLFFCVINVAWALLMALAVVVSVVGHKWWTALLDIALFALFAFAAGVTHGVWRERKRV